MYLNKLDVKDFCSIRNDAFVFKPGFNLITGPNGSGKSSVLKALSYALLNTTEKTIADYVNWDAKGFEVGLDFSINDAKSVLKNTYNGRNSNKTLDIEGETYENSDATSKLSAIFDPTLCKYSVFSSQGDLDIIYATPAQRRDLLKTIYNLNFDEALATLEQDEEHINDQIKAIDVKIAELEAVAKQQEHDYQPLPFTDEEAARYTQEKIEIEADIYKLNQKKQELESRMGNTSQYKSQLSLAEAELTRLTNNIIYNSNISEKAKLSIENFAADEEKLTTEFNEALEKYQVKLSSIKNVRPPAFIEDGWKEAGKLVSNLEFAIKSLKEEIEVMKKGTCPTCNKPFSSEELKVHTDNLAELEMRRLNANMALAQHESSRQNHLDVVEKNTQADKEREMTQRNMDAIQTNYKAKLHSYQDNLVMNKKSLEESTSALQELDKNKTQLEKTISELKVLLASSGDTSVEASVEMINMEIANLEAQIKQIDKDLKELDEVKAVNKKVKTINEGIRESIAKALLALEGLTKDKDKAFHELEVIKEGKNLLKKDLPNFILQRLAVGLEVTANEFLDRAYNGRYHIKLVDSKSGIDIVFGEKEKSVLMASGAEKSLINLGIKLGLSKLSGMGILFLDEVDAYMAEDIAGEVFDVFQDLISQKFIDQIFVISHKESVKELLEENYNANVFVMGGN